MLYLRRSDFDAMVRWARDHVPEEACGLIAGTQDESGDRRVERVFYLTNVDHSNEHFALDPLEQLKAVREAREAGLAMLGNWHSHPESPSRPSEEDKRLAYDSTAEYLILSLMDPESPVLNAFHVGAEKDVSKNPIELVEG